MPRKKTEKRRNDLLEAATRVFASKGYRAASVADIIGAAGIARGTFYLYFEGKQDVFLAVIDTGLEGLRGIFEAMAPAQASEAIYERGRRRLRHLLDWCSEHKDLMTVLLREGSSADEHYSAKQGEITRAFDRIWAPDVSGMLEEKIIAPYDRRVVSAFVRGALNEVILSQIASKERPDVDHVVEVVQDFLLHGFLHRKEHMRAEAARARGGARGRLS